MGGCGEKFVEIFFLAEDGSGEYMFLFFFDRFFWFILGKGFIFLKIYEIGFFRGESFLIFRLGGRRGFWGV